MAYLIFAIALLVVFISGIWVVKKFRIKYQPNRWLAGFLGPFIIIVPLITAPSLPSVVWAMLIVLFIWTNIYFFEVSREMLETGKTKTGFGRRTL
ncbi:hypothetical protein [Alkalibacterium sp. AK22]|uniref:hypothetical protein n=1 Tax=Alkalibacterium sp. AK22 TaxID=1229520 RepID=UPI00054D5243|nr:hypothetical protein [Alkalibacterium sp. AK22]